MAISQVTTNGVTKNNTDFAQDVKDGLNACPKKLSSKYFYDEAGDKLFQEIMNMPEYYLTNAEFEIFESYKQDILSLFGEQHFDLFELGAGDGTKTKVLLHHFLQQKADFHYRPIDISPNVLIHLENDLGKTLPQLNVVGLEGDYFEVLGQLSARKGARKVVLFLGANIGNLSPTEAIVFLRKLKESLAEGDLLMIGFDLKKDPAVILNAYNDPAGITAAFNLNLLHRINHELGANFELDNFKHWETYDPLSGSTKSFIVSKEKQKVWIEAFCQSIPFEAWETIEVELSQKYALSEIESLAKQAGFQIAQHFFDSKHYFVDSIWQV